jgi:hypothetical protein
MNSSIVVLRVGEDEKDRKNRIESRNDFEEEHN